MILLVFWLFFGCIQPAQSKAMLASYIAECSLITNLITVVSINYNSTSNLIPLGSYVTFTCMDFQSQVPFLRSFKVTLDQQRPLLTMTQDNINILKESDIFTERSSPNLTLIAGVTNNLTEIQCSDGGTFSEDSIQVIVIGKIIDTLTVKPPIPTSKRTKVLGPKCVH